MLRKFAMTLVLMAATGAAGLTALPSTADAHRLGFFFERPHARFFFGAPFFLGPPIVFNTFNSCYWLRLKAERTGSRYWWDRYEDCRFDRF